MLKTMAVTFVSFWVLSVASPLESYSAEKAQESAAPKAQVKKSASRSPASVGRFVVSTPGIRNPVARDEAWLTPKNSPALPEGRRWKLMQANPSLQAWSPGGFGDSTGNIWKSKYFQSGSGYHWLP